MNSIADGSVHIQTSSDFQFATPSWLGEVALVASHLQKQGILNKVCERVRFARRRFGRYETIDFLAVLFGYAISGERTLEAFYEGVHPFAVSFMALFGRASLPAASTLSRFLAALPAEPVEALRTLFLEDLLARRLSTEEQDAGLWDRQRNRWLVFDVDGTRRFARQRALPKSLDRPAPQRRLRPLCAPGYIGRKRGEIVRTRTTVLQMHTHQWVASFGNPGNGQYREELRWAKAAIKAYVKAHDFPAERTLLRLDGQYGSGAVISDLADFAYVTRGKDYGLLDHPAIQARLHLPADQHLQSAESEVCRALYDCPEQRLPENGPLVRVIVATHPAPTKKNKKRQVGVIRDGIVYELFLTNLPQSAFAASDVISLYLHRGAFETAWRTKTRSLSLTAGVATPPADRKPGRSWLNGHGTSARRCPTSWHLSQCALRNLLPPRLPSLSSPCPLQVMVSLRWRPLSKRVAFLGKILPSRLMGPCVARLARSCLRMNTAQRPMAACVWSMGRVFALDVRVRCASSANGVEVRQPNRAR